MQKNKKYDNIIIETKSKAKGGYVLKHDSRNSNKQISQKTKPNI